MENGEVELRASKARFWSERIVGRGVRLILTVRLLRMECNWRIGAYREFV